MKLFERSNPVPVFIYFVSAAVLCAVLNSPFYTAVTFAAAIFIFFASGGRTRTFLLFAAFALITAAVNPLISKKGDTPLLFIGDSPVTLEAILYGINTAFVLFSVLLLFSAFSKLITAQKLLYLTAPLSGAAAITLSMALRFAPMYAAQARLISDQQKVLGGEGNGTLPEKTKNRLRVFLALATWALENGVVISDSMAGRGYGVGRRRFYSVYKFRYEDIVMTAILTLLAATVAVSALSGGCTASFYPVFTPPDRRAVTVVCRISYTLLAALPVAAELADRLKWKYLISKI